MAYSANQRLEPKVYTLWHNKLWLAVTAHADVSDIEASESNRSGFLRGGDDLYKSRLHLTNSEPSPGLGC
jgi:hypothetical protein